MKCKNTKCTSYDETRVRNCRRDPENCLKFTPAHSPGAGMMALQRMIHRNAVDHGWWETERPVPEILCLIHSEVSEALEAYRNGDDDNFREELADIAIRLLDAAEGYGIDLGAEIVKKHMVNLSREYRHGGKRC